MDVSGVFKLVAFDVGLTVVFGFSGIHAVLVEGGELLGDALGIEPLFEGGHDHGAHGQSVAAADGHAGHDHSEHAANDDHYSDGSHANEIFSDQDPAGFEKCFNNGGEVHPHENAMACTPLAA